MLSNDIILCAQFHNTFNENHGTATYDGKNLGQFVVVIILTQVIILISKCVFLNKHKIGLDEKVSLTEDYIQFIMIASNYYGRYHDRSFLDLP